MSTPPGFSDDEKLDDLVASGPQEFANLEAYDKARDDRWHMRLARLLGLRPKHPAHSGPPALSEQEQLHRLAVEEKREFPKDD